MLPSAIVSHTTQVPNSLVAKPLSVTVFVRDRVTGDTLPVIITSSQPPPLELQPGTTTFDDGILEFPPHLVPKSELAPPRESDCGAGQRTSRRERVLRCGDHGSFNSLPIGVVLPRAFARFALHLTLHVPGAACLFSKRTIFTWLLQPPRALGHPLRNPSKRSPKPVILTMIIVMHHTLRTSRRS